MYIRKYNYRLYNSIAGRFFYVLAGFRYTGVYTYTINTIRSRSYVIRDPVRSFSLIYQSSELIAADIRSISLRSALTRKNIFQSIHNNIYKNLYGNKRFNVIDYNNRCIHGRIISTQYF